MSGENTPPRGNTSTSQDAQIAAQWEREPAFEVDKTAVELRLRSVQQMLILMEQNMEQMQSAVLGKLDQMTDRIAQLEKSLNTVMTQAGIDPNEVRRQVDSEIARLNEEEKRIRQEVLSKKTSEGPK